jgi:hypothetical protein
MQPNTPNDIEAIVEEFKQLGGTFPVHVDIPGTPSYKRIADTDEAERWLRSRLTLLNANRTAEMEAREEASNRRGYAEGLADGLARKI